MKYMVGAMAVMMVVIFTAGADALDGKDKPKYTIKEVMKEAHQSGLMKKVAAGTAEKEDREKLAELYKALMQNTPPVGDEGEWKKTTAALHKVAEEAIKDADAGKKLKVNCGACHKKFKG